MRALAQRALGFLKGGESPTAYPGDRGEAILLDTPLAKLKAPLLIDSSHVGDTLYLVANEKQAREIEGAGGIAYRPSEVRSILATSEGMDGDSLTDYLSKCHEVKRTFRGVRIQ